MLTCSTLCRTTLGAETPAVENGAAAENGAATENVAATENGAASENGAATETPPPAQENSQQLDQPLRLVSSW